MVNQFIIKLYILLSTNSKFALLNKQAYIYSLSLRYTHIKATFYRDEKITTP